MHIEPVLITGFLFSQLMMGLSAYTAVALVVVVVVGVAPAAAP